MVEVVVEWKMMRKKGANKVEDKLADKLMARIISALSARGMDKRQDHKNKAHTANGVSPCIFSIDCIIMIVFIRSK